MELQYSPSAAQQLVTPIQRVYLLYGEDDRLKDEALDRLREVAVDQAFLDFDLEVLDAETATSERILSSAGLAPFASPVRLVIVRGAELYRRREKQGEAERLAQGIARLGEKSCLVLRAAASEDEAGRGKTALTTKLDAAIRDRGALVRCRALTPEAMAAWLHAEAKAAGKKLSGEAIEMLMAVGKGDRIALRNELEKAICYVGEGAQIDAETIQTVCSFDAEDVMFRLIDAISNRNGDRALHLFRELLRYDSRPQSISGRLLAMLSRQFRLIWQARELYEQRLGPTDVKNLPVELACQLPSEASITSISWKAADLFRMARNWERPALAVAFRHLMEVDLSNKGGEEGSSDPIMNLELLILSLCGAK